MHSWIIRPAMLGDLPLLHRLWHALVAEQGLSLDPDDSVRWAQEMARRLERQDRGEHTIYIRVAVDAEDQLLGFLSGQLETRLIGVPHAYWLVDHLYVVPGARGQGLGRALLLDGLTYVTPDALPVEWLALAADSQWALRGCTSLTTRYTVTLLQAHVQYGTVTETDVAAPIDAQEP